MQSGSNLGYRKHSRSATYAQMIFTLDPEAPHVRITRTVEVVSRDRAGLYAEAAREGAPQARQVADRFHLLQNFRETIERQLGGYEAPIPESHVNPDDSQATLPLLAQSDCALTLSRRRA
jgi:Transposase